MAEDDEPEIPLLTEAGWAEVRTLAADVARTIGDLGLPVKVVEEHIRLGPGNLPTPAWSEHLRERQATADEEPLTPGATVTIVVDERHGHEPWVGVCVSWEIAEAVRKAGLRAFEELVEADDGFPDPLPAPIRRSGLLTATMRDAIRSALTADGFATREDTDYRPYSLWLVTDPDDSDE